MYPVPNFLTMTTNYCMNNNPVQNNGETPNALSNDTALTQSHTLINSPAYSDIIAGVSEADLNSITEAITILSTKSATLITLSNISLLTKARSHATSFAKGWLSLIEHAEASNVTELINPFEELLLSSAEHAQEIGDILGQSLTACNKYLFDNLSIEFYINTLMLTPSSQRAALITGLTNLYLSGIPFNEETVLLVHSKSHIAKEIGSFWYYLAKSYPLEATATNFKLMIETPNSIETLLRIQSSPLFSFFLAMGLFEEVIIKPDFCERMIMKFCSKEPSLLAILTNCFTKNPEHTHMWLRAIIHTLYTKNLLCFETVESLSQVPHAKINDVLKGLRKLSSHLSLQDFHLLCACRSNLDLLSHELLRISLNQTVPPYIFYTEEIYLVILKMEESKENKQTLYEKANSILQQCATEQLSNLFNELENIINNDKLTFCEKMSCIDALLPSAEINHTNIARPSAAIQFSLPPSSASTNGLKRRASCASLLIS